MTAVWVWLFLPPGLQTHFSRQEKTNMADKGSAMGIVSDAQPPSMMSELL